MELSYYLEASAGGGDRRPVENLVLPDFFPELRTRTRMPKSENKGARYLYENGKVTWAYLEQLWS